MRGQETQIFSRMTITCWFVSFGLLYGLMFAVAYHKLSLPILLFASTKDEATNDNIE